jgi:hypothetical protein
MVEKYRFNNDQFVSRPYEGRQQASFSAVMVDEMVKLHAGTFVIPTNQRTLRVIINLLEPAAPDSFAKWGFFNSFFERKEYVEDYIMEPIAKQMMKENPKLRDEFYSKLNSNEGFRNDPSERLDFFYRNSPYFDKLEKIYPVMRTNEELF